MAAGTLGVGNREFERDARGLERRSYGAMLVFELTRRRDWPGDDSIG
jgi:hypothetical protein